MTEALLKTAIIYDFDGTLARGNIQEHSFIPEIGMTREEFWDEVDQRKQRHPKHVEQRGFECVYVGRRSTSAVQAHDLFGRWRHRHPNDENDEPSRWTLNSRL